MRTLPVLACMLLSSILNLSFAQCPTTSCADHSTIIRMSELPECGDGTLEFGGDIDNNSDCEDAGGDNCWRYTFLQDIPGVTGITLKVGKGNGCNGEVDVFYTEIDGFCTDRGSAGSQNTFTFDFGIEGVITLWLCDGSSGQVSICDLCAALPVPTPVDLVSFSGKAMEFTNEIEWATATEEASSFFMLERSINGRSNFESLGTMAAQGYSSEMKKYKMKDRNPFPITYYRLHSIDIDGTTEISDWVAVKREKAIKGDQLHVFPLPLGSQPLQVFYQANIEEAIIVTISDISGRLLYSDSKNLPRGIHNWSIDLPQFEEGLLVLKIHSRSNIQTTLIPRIID